MLPQKSEIQKCHSHESGNLFCTIGLDSRFHGNDTLISNSESVSYTTVL